MSHALQSISELSADSRERLETWLMRFDQDWSRGLFAKYAGRIPDEFGPCESLCLLELAKVDLDRQWSDGRRVAVEDYLRDFPRLGTAATVSAELLLAEYLARKAAGERNVSQDLIHRFPGRASDFQELQRVDQADESFAARRFRARDTSTGESETRPRSPNGDHQPPGGKPRTPMPVTPAVGEDLLPEEFGRYRIVKRLGHGAMGAVYLAEDTQLGRKVALKTPRFAPGMTAEFIARFHREARAAANLWHANLCPVYDVGDIDGVQFITMAFIDGHTLAKYIKRGQPIAERTAAALVRKLALGLQHAHEAGVIHRDLKPANIMIDRQKEPIIMDFGLARQLDTPDESRMTQEGMILGTPAYMSPEQVEGDLNAGSLVDVYSLGVILFELVTGRLPFEGSATAVIGKIASQDPPRPSELHPDLDPAIESICCRMMARQSEDRYASMRDVAAALTDYLKQPRPPALPADTERGAAAATDGEESGLQALFEAVEEEPPSNFDPTLPERRPAGRPGSSVAGRRRTIPAAWKWTALGGLAVAIVFSIVLILKRPDGSTLRVEVDDPNLTVLLDGDRLTLTDKAWEGKKKEKKHTLAVKIGDQTLQIGSKTGIKLNDGRTGKLTLMLNGAELSSDTFEIVRGKTTVLKIRLETKGPRQTAHSKVPSGKKRNRASGNAPPFLVAPFDAATARKHQQAWAKSLGVPVEWELVIGKDKGGKEVKVAMVLIPPGEFLMGSTEKVQSHWLTDAIAARARWSIQHISSEVPQHRVRITKPFYLGKYEVTQAQWQQLMTTDPSRFKNNPTHPVEQATWHEIQAFLTKLRAQSSTVENMTFVLPTEAQWEYACRAGTTTNWYEGDSEADLRRCGWFQGNSKGTTHPVGRLKPNAFGLYDMHGNVFEVCEDWYTNNYYSKSPVDDPPGSPRGGNRAARGGAFDHHARACRSAYRNHHPLNLRFIHLGFRLALSIDLEKTMRKTAGGPRKQPAHQQPPIERVLSGHEDRVVQVRFTPDGTRLVSASNGDHHTFRGRFRYHTAGKDNSIRVWKLETGKEIRRFPMTAGSRYGPQGICFSPDGRLLAASSGWRTANGPSEPRVYVWDLASSERKHLLSFPNGHTIRSLTYSPDGSRLSVIRSGRINSWSMPGGKPLPEILIRDIPHAEAPEMTWSSDARFILSGAWDGAGVVYAWDAVSGEIVKEFKGGHTKQVHQVVLSSDGTHVLSCARDFSVRLWDWKTTREIRRVDNLDSNVHCVAFSPDGKRFLTGSRDGTVTLRETATFKELAKFQGHNGAVTDVTFSPNGLLAASGSTDKTARLWVLPTPRDGG